MDLKTEFNENMSYTKYGSGETLVVYAYEFFACNNNIYNTLIVVLFKCHQIFNTTSFSRCV